MNYIGDRRTRDLAFVHFLREARRALRNAIARESLTWFDLIADEIEQAICVRCLTLEDVLHAIMEAKQSGSIIDPLPYQRSRDSEGVSQISETAASQPPKRRRWFRW